MRPKHPTLSRGGLLRLAAHEVVAVISAILLVAEPARAEGSFSPSLFTFAPTVKDAGKGRGGGWQEASAVLRFVDTRPFIPKLWSCRVTVGMPLRTAILGQISPEYAAATSAAVATKASGQVMHRKENWLAAEYCKELKDEMNLLFLDDYPALGARVNSP